MHTLASIYLHIVFATWSRKPFLTAALRPRLHAYLAAGARQQGVAYVHVGGHDDHVHLFGRFDPAVPVSDVIGGIKRSSTSWLQEELNAGFRWQRGYGAFSVSIDRVPGVVRYVQRQEEHHRRVSFADELEALIREQRVDVDIHLS